MSDGTKPMSSVSLCSGVMWYLCVCLCLCVCVCVRACVYMCVCVPVFKDSQVIMLCRNLSLLVAAGILDATQNGIQPAEHLLSIWNRCR